MCAPASLNELIMQFFLYLLQLLRSGGLKGNSVQLLQAVIFRPLCCWVVASLRQVTSYFAVHLLNPPLQSNPPLNPVHTGPIQMPFENHRIYGVSVSQEPENEPGVLFSRVHMWTHAQQSSSEMSGKHGSHASVYLAAIRDQPAVSCSILHFVLLPRTQRNVSVNSGDTLYK